MLTSPSAFPQEMASTKPAILIFHVIEKNTSEMRKLDIDELEKEKGIKITFATAPIKTVYL